LFEDPGFRKRIAELEIRTAALEFAELVSLARMSRGESPGPGSSLAKNTSVDIDQQLLTRKLEAIQHYGLPHANFISLNGHNEAWVGPDYAETVTARYLNARAASVFGGSKEVQKNIIAKAVLGL
jgi:alkylation response protein AidB-like acyl-CoA dehydrogenase